MLRCLLFVLSRYRAKEACASNGRDLCKLFTSLPALQTGTSDGHGLHLKHKRSSRDSGGHRIQCHHINNPIRSCAGE